jgi:phosphate-selective porin OprO/OprP
MRKILFLSALMLLAPSVSQAKTLEDLLVEKGVITKGEAGSAKGGGQGSTSYSQNGTRFDFPQEGFSSGFNVLLMEAYTFTDNDNDTGERNTSSFDMKQARVYLHGTALNEEFEYLLNGDFVGDTASRDRDAASQDSGANLVDAYLKWNSCDTGWVRIGQFRTGISRQFNNSDYKLQFADRSIASDFFDLGRQQGADTSWNLADGMVTVGAGIFNGESTGEGINQTGLDTDHTGVVNFRVNPVGKMDSYSEGDVEWTEDLAMSFGGAYAHGNFNLGQDLSTGGDFDEVNVDANLKFMGWSANAEFFYGNVDIDGTDSDVEPLGFYAQAGYFIDPKVVELAASYSMIDCDDGKAGVVGGSCTGSDKVQEAKLGVNYFWWGHNLKAQLNYVFLNQDTVLGDDVNTNKWVLQFTQYL